jgi:hypothetical protein
MSAERARVDEFRTAIGQLAGAQIRMSLELLVDWD